MTDTLPLKGRITFAFVSAAVLAVLLLISSVGGLLYTDALYHYDVATLPALLGQDGVTLILGIPILIIAMVSAKKGSVRGLLLFTGIFFYFAYSYYFYAIGVKFNVLFPVYVAIVSISLHNFIVILIKIDYAKLSRYFSEKMPVRSLGVFFVIVSLLFTFLWSVIIIRDLTGTVEISSVEREVIFLDFITLLPLTFYSGLLLFKRNIFAMAVTGTVLFKIAVLGITLIINTLVASLWGLEADPSQTAAFAFVAAGSITGLVFYLRRIKTVK